MRWLLWALCLHGCNNAADEPPPAIDIDTKKLADLARPVVRGTIRSEGGPLGTWDVALDDCQSGELNGFYGADFFVSGTTKLRLRYVHDEASGDVVKIFYPTEKKAAVFDRNDCKVLEGSVSKMNVRTRVSGKGDIRHVEGHVKYDCTTDSGHVTGDVTFSHCH